MCIFNGLRREIREYGVVSSKKNKTIIIGAGPSGITAGLEILKNCKHDVVILEKDNVVGGLSKTTDYKGCKFDIGPHHFITHSPIIEQWWKDLMKGDFHPRKRFTRIYYKNYFFNYPLEPVNIFKGLGVIESLKCILSYIRICMFPIKKVQSFSDWVTNRFGDRLFNTFFKTYTEKVWGIKCDEISADWASAEETRF